MVDGTVTFSLGQAALAIVGLIEMGFFIYFLWEFLSPDTSTPARIAAFFIGCFDILLILITFFVYGGLYWW